MNKELVVGTWLQTGDTVTAEILAECGYDFIAADIEHTSINEKDFVDFARAVRGRTAPFARVENSDEMAIRRVLDLGAEGVIVPMVNNAEQARDIVSAAKYAPQGKRGFAFVRANKYGVAFDEYAKTANEQITVIAMVETKEAVENIDEILSVDGIDGVFIGPYDLSGSYGIVGQVDHQLIREAKVKVLESCRRHNKAAGQHIVNATRENVSEAIEQGYTFLALGTDTIFLNTEARKTIALVK
ncbi:MAG: 2,4-dihydroxyhept-2-ene-1,7-dioic acid aldolase [Clostridia bacterium]|nr:2,4-dihydroxyhept-2-ene-1,7-dioic acid aldolase [Clostridia bacterium]